MRVLAGALLIGITMWGQSPKVSVTLPTVTAISPKLSDLKDNKAEKFLDHRPLELPTRKSSGQTTGQASVQHDAALQTQVGPLVAATQGTQFDGIAANGSAPPDTNIAVGPNHVFEMVNSRYQIYNKSGTVLVPSTSLSSLWASLSGGRCSTSNSGDPVVQYDRLADRWVITELGALSSPYSQCIGISLTSDPTGAYKLYEYSYGTNLNDYPKFGVWPTATNSAYTATYNLFANGGSFAGGQMCAYDRAAMLASAATPAAVCYTITTDGSFLPVDLDGATRPTDGTPAYFLTWETSTTLRMYKLAPNFANPGASTLTQMPDLAVASFAQACSSCVPQPGTTQTLDTLSDRPMYRLAYRMFGDHASMVTNHTVTAGTSIGVRWYELRSTLAANTSFSVFQQGTFAPDSTYRWMGSAAMDQSGGLAIGYSASSSTLTPSLRFTGRAATDALGTLQTEAVLFAGAGSQGTNLSRWGDYSALRIDPSDDCTFWYGTEYEPSGTGTFNWRTRIGSFKLSSCGVAPAPDFSMSASPTSLSFVQGGGGTSNITVTPLNGYAGTVGLTVSGCPANATCTVNPTSGSSVLTVTTLAGVAVGSFPVTVTGTDGTLTHSATVTLNIASNAPPADFGISVSPTTFSINKGSSGTATVTLTSINSASSVTLSISGLPGNASATFSPNPKTTPGTSTLTINTVKGTKAGTYNAVITGKNATFTHTTPLTVIIK